MNQFVIAVLGAGVSWGFLGFFTRHMAEYGIGSTSVIILRCGIAAICFGILSLATGPSQLKIKWKDLWCFIGSGLFSLLFFTFCYYNAINMMSLSAAAILLYTAPIIVMLLSAPLFGEKISGIKLLAVGLAFAGCCLVCGITGGVSLTPAGLLYGLGSGFGYALYSIFARYALQRGYTSAAINFYSCLLASLGAAVLWGTNGCFSIMCSSIPAFLWCSGVGVLVCFLPFLLYTYGLTGLENGKASVIASVEPVVATLIGIIVYREKMTLPSLLGVVLVLGAVAILNCCAGEK